LDDDRARQLLDLAQTSSLGQTFITSTERERFIRSLDLREADNAMYEATNGTVVRSVSNS